MRILRAFLRSCSLLLLLAIFCSLLHATPRLGLTAERLSSLRKAVVDTTDPRHPIYLALKRSVLEDSKTGPERGPFFTAIRASFLYQLTGQPEYADLAYSSLRSAYASTPKPHEADGRTRASASLALAYTWDWTRTGTTSDREWLRVRIREMLAAWPHYQDETLAAGMEGASLTAVCRGSEVILLLASEAETRQKARYESLKQQLLRHMQAFDEIGVSFEGSAYPGDGGPYLLRALLALRDVGDSTLEDEAAKHAWWRHAMYSGAFSLRPDGGQRSWLMSGTGGPSIGDSGWASLLLGFVPRQDLPYFLWWYSHHMGAQSPGNDDSRYDPNADGTVWALLLYPERSPLLDPTGVFPSGIRGSSGQVLLRNRWRNRADIQIAMDAGTKNTSLSKVPPATFHLRVLAHGETWIGGPDNPASPGSASTLLVDGMAPTIVHDSGGTIRRADFWLDGAYIVVDGSDVYRSLGVEKTERHLLVHFDQISNDLLLNTLDRVKSSSTHSYTWQLNLGEPEHVRRVTRDRRLYPVRNQAFVFVGGGWPLCSVVGQPLDTQDDLKIQYQDPIRVETSGKSAELRLQLRWTCSGGAFGPNSTTILEAPRLSGSIVRTETGDLALVRSAPTAAGN
jgi:hypothetical protein